MTAHDKTERVRVSLHHRGVEATHEQAEALRRAELTLQRWGEQECGYSDDYASRGLERDEETGKPFYVVRPHDSNKTHRSPTPDREAGALRRVAAICKELGAHFYHQDDPRGCALYVGPEPLTDQNYTGTGAACCP